MRTRHKLVALAAASAVMLSACSWISGDNAKDIELKPYTVGSTEVYVDANTDGGKVTATAVAKADAPGPEFAKVLANPVHLEVDGGTLKGEATVAFKVDTALLGGIAPDSGFVSIYARGPETDDQWQLQGGDYDQETGLLSVPTEHFSDWTYAVTDFDAILRSQAWQKRRDEQGSIANFLYGRVEALACPTDEIPLDYAYSVGYGLDTCLTQSVDTKEYHLQLANASHTTLELSVPPALTLTSDPSGDITGNSAAYTFYAALMQVAGQPNLIMPPGARYDFTAAPGTLPRDTMIHADIAWGLQTVAVANALFDVVTYERLSGLKDEVANNALYSLKDPKQAKEFLDCVDTFTSETKQAYDGQSAEAEPGVALAGAVASECYSSYFDVAASGIYVPEHAKTSYQKRLKTGIVGLKKVLDVKKLLDDSAELSRDYVSLLINGAGKLASALPGNQGYDITASDLRLRPGLQAKSLEQALPYVDERPDLIASNYPANLMIGCYYGFDDLPFEAFDGPGGESLPEYKVGFSGFDVPLARRGYEAHISIGLSQAVSGSKPELTQAVDDMPSECSGVYGYGDAGNSVITETNSPETGADAIRTYEFTDNTMSDGYEPGGFKRYGYQVFAASNGYLLQYFYTYDGDHDDTRDALTRRFFRDSVYVDDHLGTNFSGQN